MLGNYAIVLFCFVAKMSEPYKRIGKFARSSSLSPPVEYSPDSSNESSNTGENTRKRKHSKNKTNKNKIKRTNKRMSKEKSKRLIKQIRNRTVDKLSLAGIVIKNVDFKYLKKTLSNANMNNSYMKNVGFNELDLTRTNFTYAELDDVEFTDVTLFNTKFMHSTIINTSFSLSEDAYANFTDCTLTGTVFYSNFMNSIFDRATFKNVVFSWLDQSTYDKFQSMLTVDQKAELFIYTLLGERVLFDSYTPEIKKPDEKIDDDDYDYDYDDEDKEGDVNWVLGARSNVKNCPSKGLKPTKDCSLRKMQSLIFHPDKNPGCPNDAVPKFQKLNEWCPTKN